MASSQNPPTNQTSRPAGLESSEEMRQAILMSLGQLRSEGARNSLVIKRLRDQYNNIMEQAEREASASAIDPLGILPPEISLRCLRESLVDHDYPQRLLDLTMVSKRWQDLIVSTPVLWMRIDIRGSQHDAMATLAVYLELSRTTSIYLTIWNDPGDEWDDLATILFYHRQRICTIEMKHEKKQTPALQFSIASRIMRSLRPLSASSHIHFGESFPAFSSTQLQELSSYSNRCILQNFDTRLSDIPTEGDTLGLIGSITTTDALAELGPQLASMINLTAVWFTPSPFIDVPIPTSPFAGGPPRLASIVYHQDFDISILLLIISVVDTLRSLTLGIPSSKWRHLFNCLIGARNLKELHVELERSVPGEPEAIPFVPLTPVRSLESLHLAGYWWSGSGAVRNPGEVTFKEVFEGCAMLYPSIQSFTLDYFNFDSDYRALSTYLETLDSLQYLRIRGRTPNWEVDITPPVLRSLKRLDTQSTLLPYIEAPNLEWFTISGEGMGWFTISSGEGMETTRFSSILGAHIWFDSSSFYGLEPSLNDRNYPALVHLTLQLPAPGSAWYMPEFQLLRSVKIMSQNRLDHNATMFCLSILYYPAVCPQLEEVELSGFVEWDILILMLERRNFMKGGIKRISTLRLPVTPPFLETPLASLLSGKYADQPSNKDLSTEGIREALCSVDVPGCIYCVKNMIPGCKEEVTKGHGVFFGLDRFYTGYPQPPLTLPPDILTWLRWHSDRIQALTVQWIVFEHEYCRQTACSQYPSGPEEEREDSLFAEDHHYRYHYLPAYYESSEYSSDTDPRELFNHGETGLVGFDLSQ